MVTLGKLTFEMALEVEHAPFIAGLPIENAGVCPG